MRIGYFGGSFDPPHRGHLAVASAARDAFALDRVLLAPTARQPLKPGGPVASFEDRLRMTELLCAGQPRLEASAIDGPRPNGEPNYTADTLRRLHAQLIQSGGRATLPDRPSPPPNPATPSSSLNLATPSTSSLKSSTLKTSSLKTSTITSPFPVTNITPPAPEDLPKIFAILGADAFLTLPHWRQPEALFELADWIIVSRPGFPLPSLDAFPAFQRSRIHPLTGVAEPVDATSLRARLEVGESCAAEIPNPVLTELLRRHLYGG